MENNQQWSQGKPKKFIAWLLVVDVETQNIPHFNPEEQLYLTKKIIAKSKLAKCQKRKLHNGKYQQWSRVKSKKCIALLLVHVETQVIPHFKAKEDIYSSKKLIGKSKVAKCGEKRLNMKIDSEIGTWEKNQEWS